VKQGRLVASAPAAAALASVSARRAPAAAAWPEGPAASGSGGGWRFQERGNGGRDGGDGCCAGPPGVASSESVASAAAAAARRDGDSDGDRVYVRCGTRLSASCRRCWPPGGSRGWRSLVSAAGTGPARRAAGAGRGRITVSALMACSTPWHLE
jgi:hypothetical protein